MIEELQNLGEHLNDARAKVFKLSDKDSLDNNLRMISDIMLIILNYLEAFDTWNNNENILKSIEKLDSVLEEVGESLSEIEDKVDDKISEIVDEMNIMQSKIEDHSEEIDNLESVIEEIRTDMGEL